MARLLVRVLVLSFAWAALAWAEPPAFVLLAQDTITEPGLERTAYTGGEMRRTLRRLPATTHLRLPVAEDGSVSFSLHEELPPLPQDALGYRFEIQYQAERITESTRKRKQYAYLPRAALRGTHTVTPPGRPTPTANVRARVVYPVAQRFTTDPLDIAADSRLRVGMGLREDWRQEDGWAVAFEVAVLHGDGETVLAETTLHADQTDSAWHDVDLALDEYAGQQVRFRFSTRDASTATNLNTVRPLWGAPLLYRARVPRPVAHPPNVLLISLDTLRADRLGCYGYTRNTSPNLDRFAGESVLFETAIAPSPWTSPSHASAFTGITPLVHQAGVLSAGYHLQGSFITLAERLRDQGYLTGAFTEGVAMRGRLGFAQGFERYAEGLHPESHVTGRVEHTFGTAAEWLARFGHLPFFLFVHTYEPHAPYDAPDDILAQYVDLDDPAETRIPRLDNTPAERAHASNRYDAGIAYTDREFGRFMARVRELALLDDTLVIIFSDHGQAFWEHGLGGHASGLHDPQLHVPLIVRFPGGAYGGTRVTRQVGLSDVFATTLDVLGFDVPAGMDAASLQPLARAPESGTYTRPHVVSNLVIEQPIPGVDARYRELRSLRTGDYKLLQPHFSQPALNGSADALYDLQRDRGEQKNVAGEQAATYRALADELARFAAEAAEKRAAIQKQTGGGEALNEDDIEQLRALGYL